MKKHLTLALLLSLSVLPLNACSTVGSVTGAAAEGGKAAAQEGGIQRAWTDAKIQAQINDLWFQQDIDMFRKLDMTVNDGRVLITGVVQNPEHRVEAVRLAWKPEGVKQVINEIRVAESQGFSGYARDTWATTRLRTAITLDRKIQSINYSIDTVQGIVYLMGVAQSQGELNRVIETARTIPDVKQVISYVRVKGQKSAAAETNYDDHVSQSAPVAAVERDADINVNQIPENDATSDMNQSYDDYQQSNPQSNEPIPLKRETLSDPETSGW